MKTQKGYILPAVLIVVLLIIAGFVTFGLEKAESPVVEQKPPVTIQKPVVVDNDNSTTTATTSIATTSIEMDIGGEAIIQ